MSAQLTVTEHTFLLKEGLWRSEGQFFDGTGKLTAVEGEAHIRHIPTNGSTRERCAR